MKGYVEAKARMYMLLGPERYRHSDAFRRPGTAISEGEARLQLAVIDLLAQGEGMGRVRPLDARLEPAVEPALEAFHFKLRVTTPARADSRRAVRCYTFTHEVVGAKLDVFVASAVG